MRWSIIRIRIHIFDIMSAFCSEHVLHPSFYSLKSLEPLSWPTPESVRLLPGDSLRRLLWTTTFCLSGSSWLAVCERASDSTSLVAAEIETAGNMERRRFVSSPLAISRRKSLTPILRRWPGCPEWSVDVLVLPDWLA